MLKNLKKSLILSVLSIIMFGIIYPLFIFAVGQLTYERSTGSPVVLKDKTIGFENIGQSFTDNRYFWGRPSAVNYNTASTGGSNKGPTNPDYLAEVDARIDSIIVHNSGINKTDIPSELVTASGSGIDPHITPQGAFVQIARIAKERNLKDDLILNLVTKSIERPLFGLFGTERVNVLKLNLALDDLK